MSMKSVLGLTQNSCCHYMRQSMQRFPRTKMLIAQQNPLFRWISQPALLVSSNKPLPGNIRMMSTFDKSKLQKEPKLIPLPRYPNVSSAPGLLRGLDYFGTVDFAFAGSVTAGMAGMDLLGCTIVGTVTAIGGGTVRDLLLGNTPVFWIMETEYIFISLVSSLAAFFGWKYVHEELHIDEDDKVLRWWDAFGVGAFAVIGAQNALKKNLHWGIAICCGMMTATFGGMIRDVLCQKAPRILHSQSEIYATTALIGAATYTGLFKAGIPPSWRIFLGFGTAVASRYVAWTYDIRLPNWIEPIHRQLDLDIMDSAPGGSSNTPEEKKEKMSTNSKSSDGK